MFCTYKNFNLYFFSTGITANGKNFIFRFASAPNNTYDSDDDQSLPDTNQSNNNHLLRVNNNHNHSFNSTINSNSTNLEYNDGASTSTHQNFFNSSQKSHYNHIHNHENGRRKKYKTHESEHDFEDYVSTNNSNSLLSSTESSSNDSFHEYFNAKKRKLNSQPNESSQASINGVTASTNNKFETPSNKKTPDSGIADDTMTPKSSDSRGSASSSLNNTMTKIDVVKRNYRKNMITSDDSD